MKFNLIKVPGFEILEIYRDDIYEYYVRPYGKNNYIFVFGVKDHFSESHLKVLAEVGYFEEVE